MALTEILSGLKEKLSGIELPIETKDQLELGIKQLLSLALVLIASKRNVDKESVSRKLKIGLLYSELDIKSRKILELEAKMPELDRLSKYHEAIVADKKKESLSIKQMFDVATSSQTSKDYGKYKNLMTEFDFETLDEAVFDNNIKTFKLLAKAGTFDSNKQFTMPVLQKPLTDTKTDKPKNKL